MKPERTAPRPAITAIGLIFVCVMGLTLLLWRQGQLQPVDFWLYDFHLQTGSRPDPRLSPVVLVGITEADIKLHDYPLSDHQLARFLDLIATHQPRIIGLDLYRDLPAPRSATELRTLNEALLRHTNVVMIRRLADNNSTAIPAPAVLERLPARVGFNNFPLDQAIGNKVRRGWLFAGSETETNHPTLYSFALTLALQYLSADGIWPLPGKNDPNHLRLGKQEFPPWRANDGAYVGADDSGYQILIDYRGPHSFVSYSLDAVLDGRIPAGALRDRMVIVGAVAESMRDQHLTPFKGQTYGVELHAQLVDQLLKARSDDPAPMRILPEWQELTIALVCGLAGLVVGFVVRSPAFLLASLLVGIGLCVGLNQWALHEQVWIPVAPAMAAYLPATLLVTSYRSQREWRERRILMQLFAQHVSPEIAEILWTERAAFLEGHRPRPQALTATVLFADLQDFTRVAEKTDPRLLIDWLNQYFEAMSVRILNRGGVINEYIGDAIMATFGIPIPRRTAEEISHDAVQAVSSALEMASELTRLNERWKREGRPTAAMRIGIITGPLVTGSVGSLNRLKYAVVGDTVNAAAHLQSFKKEFNAPGSPIPVCRILVGEPTWELLGGRFAGELVGSFILKGRQEKIIIRQVFSQLSTKGES